MPTLSDFSISVIAVIQKIPKGRVATYGQIAGLAGKPHASRAVAWLLHSSSKKYKLPWHRVLNSQGKISFPFGSPHFREQKRRLEKEGVTFKGKDRVDLKSARWKKEIKIRRDPRLPRMFA